MTTYKVYTSAKTTLTIEAEYFKVTSSPDYGADAWFYVTEVDGVHPAVIQEVLVAWVRHPQGVIDVSALDRTPQEG